MAKGNGGLVFIGVAVGAWAVGTWAGLVPDFLGLTSLSGGDVPDVGLPADSSEIRDKGGELANDTANKTHEYGVRFGGFIAIALVALAARKFWKSLGGPGRMLLVVAAAVALTLMITGGG